MTTKSPIKQAQERILALEAEVERLERGKECLSWNYAQSESLAADLRQERDALQADLNALRAHLNCGLNCACRDCTLNGSEHPCKCESKYCEELVNSQNKMEEAKEALQEFFTLSARNIFSVPDDLFVPVQKADAILAGHMPAPLPGAPSGGTKGGVGR